MSIFINIDISKREAGKIGRWDDGKKREAGNTMNIGTTVDGSESEMIIQVIL